MSAFRRKRRDDARRAELLDAALTAWQKGEAPEDTPMPADLEAVEPVGDELAAAHALDAFAADAELPREPLVAIRAAIAARGTTRLPAWRRLVLRPSFASAVAAVLAATLAVGALTTIRGSDEPLTHVAAAKAEAFLATAQEKVRLVEAQTMSAGGETLDPAQLSEAIVEAQSAAASARAAAQLAEGSQRKILLAQVELQQRHINELRTRVFLLAAPTLVSPGDAAAAVVDTTTTTAAPTTTTTAAKPTTTTTAKPTTTTTAKPTTTTVESTTSTTVLDTTTTTTPTRGKADQQPQGTTATSGF